MADLANILVVSDLHFGEELLPGASFERRRAIELGAAAFCEFLKHHAVRRKDGRPWRLIIAGDLFDFMSVALPGTAERPVKTRDERIHGLPRSAKSGVLRMRAICANQQPVLAELVRFAAAGHRIEIIAGNHDIELVAPEVVAEFEAQLRAVASGDERALARISVVPWFVHVPGVAWIEHGHVYDEGCSFEFNLAPMDPKDGNLIFNADYAAVRYLGQAVPEIDPHGIESWSFWGYVQYVISAGLRSGGRMWLGYARFIAALFRARRLHQSVKRRDRRRREHRARLVEIARTANLPLDKALAIDRLARAPLTASLRRVARLLMLDRFCLILGVALAAIIALVALPIGWALAAIGVAAGGAFAVSRWLGISHVTSQIPMRAIPQRIRKQVDVPLVVFGHTHDPRWQRLARGGVYINAGTWLPATKPGLRRCFTHLAIEPRSDGGPPHAELRQWREGGSVTFDATANVGAGVTITMPGLKLEDA